MAACAAGFLGAWAGSWCGPFTQREPQACYPLEDMTHQGDKKYANVSPPRAEPAGVLPSWFLGPRAEYRKQWADDFQQLFQDYAHWRRNFSYSDPPVHLGEDKAAAEQWRQHLDYHLGELTARLKAHFPVFSPRYVAHMTSELLLPGVLGYFAAMLYNPNNVTNEVAPVTVDLELEAGRMIATMLGLNAEECWAHICSGGTVANLEALWAARMAPFVPLAVKDAVRRLQADTPDLDVLVHLPDGRSAAIEDVDDAALMWLKPCEALALAGHAEHVCRDAGLPETAFREAYAASVFNPVTSGYLGAALEVGKKPVILVSEAHHYSIEKAADVLGFGSTAVRRIPVDARFRIDVGALEEQIAGLGEDEYLTAVVAVAGTTEEGAVDPLNGVADLRSRLERAQGRSFWLHVDAAWGGYFASMFRNRNGKFSGAAEGTPEVAVGVAEAYEAVPNADSVTIDPHKMGYVPYPAGAVVFKDKRVKAWFKHEAQYISGKRFKDAASAADEENVGPFVFEGSKPGAAAAACWLAHKTVPLDKDGHGRIVRETVSSARRLWRLLEEYHGPKGLRFVALTEPDTNIVCYVARAKGASLERMNRLNHGVYRHLTIDRQAPPHGMRYFVSRTILRPSHYAYQSLAPFLARLDVSAVDYAASETAPAIEETTFHVDSDDHGVEPLDGVFVLRSTLMNPWYEVSRRPGSLSDEAVPAKDYLSDYVTFLSRTAEEVLAALEGTGQGG